MKLKEELKHHKWLIISLLGLCISFFISIFLITSMYIGKGVKRECNYAKEKYQGDCVQALIKVIQEEKNGFVKRNYAIWALGQMGDKRALPVLKSYYTARIPEKEPYHKGISQYELRKAINLIESGKNISAIVWRK